MVPGLWVRGAPASTVCSVAVLAALTLVVQARAADTDASATPDLPPELISPDADLVRAARTYLDQGRLGPAIETGDAAVARNALDRDAHLVLARALAAVRVHHPDAICAWEAWQDRILDHVAAAWSLDGTLLDRIESDPELVDLRRALQDTIALRLWPTRGRAWKATAPPRAAAPTGLPVRVLKGTVKRRFAEPLLVAFDWHGLDADGEHDGTTLDLRPDGTAVRATVERDADRTKHARYAFGNWSLDRDGLRVELEGEPAELAVTLAGLQVGEGDQVWIRWSDQPYDCTRPFDVWADLPKGR